MIIPKLQIPYRVKLGKNPNEKGNVYDVKKVGLFMAKELNI
jgi:hypothetical protein